MTVSSLWTALDETGCATPVSIDDFNLRGHETNHGRNPTVLAVDMSIWICEGIASTALSTFHADPALHLVYQRATKLLKLGFGLVFVVEGDHRRMTEQTHQQQHNITSRSRSGSQFWEASKRCECMLQSLGVPVIRAEAEGEALCALLNSSGLVHGVISNDGDCFLYGAVTVYTNFTSENLENRQVMRYDAAKLAFAQPSSSGNQMSNTTRFIYPSREDLIAFAMICGSDVCGDGIPNCGYKKAIQFLHACRTMKQQCHENSRTCLDELLSWSDDLVAVANSSGLSDKSLDCDDDGPCTIHLRCCSICLHSGDKLQHEKYGCVKCGTGPGEGCCVVSSDEKFLQSLKEKALVGTIAPRCIVDQYFSPNNNNIPSSIRSLLSNPYVIHPDACLLFTTSMILKGRTKESSHQYIKSSLPKLLARLDLWDTRPRNNYVTSTSKQNKFKPIPLRIEKSLVIRSLQCYEISWLISIGVIEDDQFEFQTYESQSIVDRVLPQLVKVFHQEERRKQQGRAEEERRNRFIGRKNHARKPNQLMQNKRRDLKRNSLAGRRRKDRERNFDVPRISKMPMTFTSTHISSGVGLDVSMLIDSLPDDDVSFNSGVDSVHNLDYGLQVEDYNFLDCDESHIAGMDCARIDPGINFDSAYPKTQHQLCSLDEDLRGFLLNDINHLARLDDIGSEVVLCEYSLPGKSWDEEGEFVMECRQKDDLFQLSSRCEVSQHIDSSVIKLSNNRVFCDMGIRIEVTPIISRRMRQT